IILTWFAPLWLEIRHLKKENNRPKKKEPVCPKCKDTGAFISQSGWDLPCDCTLKP
ncbi:unnamed protein product, partial [marine sediment metagenome]